MMLVFWIIALLLLLAVLALLLPALLRPKINTHIDANVEKRSIFNQQFAELKQDKFNGVLDDTQYEVAKSELERRVLEEIEDVKHVSLAVVPDWRLAITLLLVIPLATGSLYYKLGSPASVNIPSTSPDGFVTQSMVEHSSMMGDLEPLLESLKKKLEKDPGNGEGWALLARSYVEIRQHAESILAYKNAAKIITDDPQLLADYADALAVVNGHKLAGAPEVLVNQALKLDPHHGKALMLAATAAFDRKDYKQAISYWNRLQQDLPADSEILPVVKASLHEVQVLSGEKVTMQPSGQPVIKATGVNGIVRILPKLAQDMDPSVTVFIFARTTQEASMPLAIVRTTVGNLPYAYHLDDSVALIPNHKLSQADKVVIVARVSKTGGANQQSGDLQGVTDAIKPDGKTVDIEINQVIP